MLWPAVFLVTAAFLLYVVLGYPLVLAGLAYFFPKPVHKAPSRESVSIIVAVHNGERFIADKLRSILALQYPRELIQILVVSDGSTDSTDTVVAGFADAGVELLRTARGGKCAALNEAIPRARGEILLLTDVRQVLEPESLERLVSCFADPGVGVVSGEVLIRPGYTHQEADIRLYWRFETWIRVQLSRIDSMFGATGPFYAMRRSLAVPIPADILLDDVYLPMAAFFAGYRLVVEPGAHAHDYPTRRDSEFRRKVRTLAGNYQLLLYYPRLLGFRNRMWFHYISYKIGRLLLPHGMFLIAVSSFFLPSSVRSPIIISQGIFYALAAFDPLVPDSSQLKRVSSPIRTFVVMMIAALVALRVFFVSPRSLWKETKVAVPRS
jgi:cellulose synthase/poly-beta-1,6-N-acetylglucosamine synthase-like glycosyltransferase